MQSAKESAMNVAASAISGKEKTKAALQEKAEKIATRDPLQKEMATEKREQKFQEAELQKQEAREHNAAAKQAASGGGGMFGTTGTTATTGAPGHTGAAGVGPGHTGLSGATHTRPVEGMGGGQYPEGQLEDPNVPGGRRTGYGAGGAI